MLAAKIKLWLLRTKTGEKNEIRLVKEENDLWYDICCPNNGEATSFYKEALERISEKRVSIISHYHFLREKSKSENDLKIPSNLVIGQLEQFVDEIEDAWHIIMSEKRFTSDIRRLKFENPKNEDLIEHLASRISILFGLIGMTISKFGDEEDKRRTLIVGAEHRSSPEWNKIKESASSIESSLEAFDASLAKSPARKSFEKYLTYLTGVLKNSKHMLWMNFDMEEQPMIHVFPADTRKIFRELIWKDVEKLHLFSHNGNFEFIKDELALPEDIKNKKLESLRGLPIFPASRKISNPNSDSNIAEVSHEIAEQVKGSQGNFFLLVTSMRSAEKFFYTLKTDKKLFVQNMGGGLGKIAKMSEKTDGNNLFVGNEEMLNNLLRDGKNIKFLAIHRLPFSYPSDPIQMSRAKYYSNEFEDYSLPKCALRLQNILDKFLGNEWQDKKVFIYDERVNDYKLLS
jgi:Rad3-related DNA helicase